ncbi:3',5'-cyclic AMP phosphodiesterase CpdA [Paenibacillus phyllosphaerae]|uniref:3',5'-cyclic AMP phosphodiesterase CpdA n=1 Tax=Paenibacillus phyllosphaerae TaxID=274593 RepID=A0A7W5B1A2_9BACL|nr:metallophosphoesterase [Paenibacillus phyllosphaerae]MBB3112412.1 3',5'-cyclic AMP phosphodiesterase CpdA [Paenibacillus phyllosphaerae]
MNDSRKPLLRFQVITDTHITADPDHDYNRHFDRALQDIAHMAPDSAGIMHVGDITDHGFETEYAEFDRIWSSNRASGLQTPILFTHGNHDLFLGPVDEQLSRYERYSGMKGAYHAHWIGSYPFIFIGSEDGGIEDFADLSKEQLAWLETKLEEARQQDRPAFLFLHQPLKHTVAGSLDGQGWHGVKQDDELRGLLERYPRTILFNGHTHWELTAPHGQFAADEQSAVMFNAASVAYLWTDEDEAKAGSQGYYVEVYADRIVVQGRDFAAGAWIEEAVYEIKRHTSSVQS